MSSIIEGYNYDIFISCRQKDNKGDRWVSEFVEALKTELESTFKEEISVYFDINPHDVLLETHDVDASLKEKLKCLVFIPIISRTYCDPKSFAWEHEFRAFVEQASKDMFGLKVKLPNGNVANRVLPVRIHDLNNDDIKLCESILGSVLRGIEFIYKSPGVNRPLRSKEDNPQDNLNHTIYRNQINKAANAINEIICGLIKEQAVPTEKVNKDIPPFVDVITQPKKSSPFRFSRKHTSDFYIRYIQKSFLTKKKIRIITFSSLVVMLVVIALFILSSGSSLPFSRRDWIIITDFENFTENPVFDKSLYTAFSLSTSQSRYINLFSRSRMFETLKRMEIKDQTFIDEKTGREIAVREEIDLYIVPGISKVGNKYAISAKIMQTKYGNLLKSEILYAETQNDILSSLDQLSKKIRRDLGESRYNIAMQDKHLEKVTTSSLEALRFYTLAIEKHAKSDFEGAREYYENALRIDTGFTSAKASLGGLYMEIFDPVRGRELLSQAVKTIDKLTSRERLAILGFYAVNVENNYSKGLEYERMRIELYPDDQVAHNNMGWYYMNSGQYENAVKEYKESVRINPHLVLAYGGILETYLQHIGNADSALVWAEKMLLRFPQNIWSHVNLGNVWICFDSIPKAIFHFRKAREINPKETYNLLTLAHACHRQKLFDEANQILKQIPKINKDELRVYYYSGVNYQSMGNQKEALRYFSDFKKIVAEVYTKNWPQDAETYFWQGLVSAKLGDMDYSQQMLLKAIKIDSTMHERSAELLCVQGKIPEALDELEKAFKNGYRDLPWLKLSPDLEILQYDIRFRDLIDKYFN
jgi:tetratricopeptide (TPR) repeat protein